MAKKFKSKASRLRRRLRKSIGRAIANKHNDMDMLLQSVMDYVDRFVEDGTNRIAYAGRRYGEIDRLYRIELAKRKKLEILLKTICPPELAIEEESKREEESAFFQDMGDK